MTTLKPFDHYPGGKNVSGTWQTIINQIPPHDEYWELFLGGGTIFQNLRTTEQFVLNDINPEVVEEWRKCAIIVQNKPAVQLLSTASDLTDRKLFIYLDPPYPRSTLKSKRDTYKFMMDDGDHLELLSMAVAVKSDCMISTYPNSMYEETLKGWRKIEFKSMTRKGLATEVIYMNYPEPDALHDYRYLGSNKDMRQRIKRKIARRVETLSNLPLLEQKAIIQELNQLIDGS